jgi:hypothetical protein
MITLFSWGYWGWGNATEQLVESADLAEKKRGFKPPVFVDIRRKRQGRAKGFVGDAFGKVVGKSRYCWMEGLGNDRIATHESGIKIVRPEAAADLLQFAIQAAQDNRRVIFYCACEFPRQDGKTTCHRDTVADLVLREAKNRSKSIAIVEWPGDEPSALDAPLTVGRKLFAQVISGRMYVPFDNTLLPTFAGTSWGSVLTINCDEQSQMIAVGPPAFAISKNQGQWRLPLCLPAERGKTRAALLKEAREWRRESGLDERHVK